MKSKMKRFMLFKGILACMFLLTSLIALTPAVSYAVEYRLEDFLILVSDQLILRGYVDILVGGGQTATPIPKKSDLGAGTIAEIGGKGLSRVPVGAPALVIGGISDDVAVIAPKIKLGNFAQVSHTICDGAGCIDDVGTVGRKGPTLAEDKFCDNSRNDTGAPCSLPDFPAFPTITIGTTDVIVPASKTVTLTPGNYRDLIVGAFGKVHFTNPITSDGIYNFRRIIISGASSWELIFDADDIQVNVQDFVRLTEFGDFNPTGAKGITLYVAGIDNSYGGANKNQPGVYGPPAAFEYDGDGLFIACFVFVKNGTINLRGKSHPLFWQTQWFGKSLQELSSLMLAFKQTPETCFEHKECACITDFKLRPDGTLRVTGFNFDNRSLERLAIFSGAYADTLALVTQGNLGKDQTFANLTILSPTVFFTNNDIATLLGTGSYLLGIMSPPTGNPSNYCIFREKLLVIP